MFIKYRTGILTVLLTQREETVQRKDGWGRLGLVLLLPCFASYASKVTLHSKIDHLVHFMTTTLLKYPQDAVWTPEEWLFSLFLGSQIETHFNFTVRINTLPTGLWFQLEMDQVSMYSLMFAKEEIAAFAIYPFRLARDQEVKVPGQMYKTHWVHIWKEQKPRDRCWDHKSNPQHRAQSASHFGVLPTEQRIKLGS